jgi:hypothetical protein
MTTYSDWDQRLLDQRSGLEGDRRKAHARRVLATKPTLSSQASSPEPTAAPTTIPRSRSIGPRRGFYWNSLDRHGDPVGPESEPFPTAEDAYNDAGGM